MKTDQFNSLLLDAIEEYGVDDILEMFNNAILKAKAKKDKQEKAAARSKDAVDLYKQILLFCNTYYPDVMPDEEAERLARAAEKNPEMIAKFIECSVTGETAPEIEVKKTAAGAAEKTPQATIKVKTNINGKEDKFEIGVDKWLDTLEEFFDKYGI